MRISHLALKAHDQSLNRTGHSQLLDFIEKSEHELGKVIPGFNRGARGKYRIIREPRLRENIPGIGQVDDAHSPDFVIVYFQGSQIKIYFVEVKSKTNCDTGGFYSRQDIETDLKIVKHYTETSRADLVASLKKYGIPEQVTEKAVFEFRGLYRQSNHIQVYVPEFERAGLVA